MNDPASPGSDPAGRDGGAAGRDRRDRDPAGRPRNARPRDALGRPLPKSVAGEPRVPDDLLLTPDASLASADELIASGRPFHAHEVLEASWKSAPDAERDFWQGLAQLAVGLTHAQRGNARGAVALLRRGAGRIERFSPANPYGVNAAAVAATAQDLADRISVHGTDDVQADVPRFRMR